MNKDTITKLHWLERERDKFDKFIIAVLNHNNISVLNYSRTPVTDCASLIGKTGNKRTDEFINKVLDLARQELDYYNKQIEEL